MNVLKTNIKKVSLLSILLFALLFFNTSHAQDLIKNTQNGLNSFKASKNIVPNNVAKQVQKTAQHTKFQNVNALQLVEGQKQPSAKKTSYLRDAVYFTKVESEIAKVMKNKPVALNFKIPVSAKKTIELELLKNDFMADGFKVKTSEGETFKIPESAVFYKGIVKGNPQSIVALSFYDGNINGVISDKDGNYNLGLMKDDNNTLVLFNENSLKTDWNGSCGSGNIESPLSTKIFKNKETNTSFNNSKTGACDTNDCVGVYCEVASDFYNERGSKAAVVEYITNVFNNASIVFDNENMKICLTHIFIWTSGDNYNGGRGARLDQFSDVVKDNDFPGAVGVLIYHVPGGDGLANWDNFNGVTILCADHTANDSGAGGNGAGYGPLGVVGFGGVAANYPEPSRDVQTFTHEVGHIFGSPHTQNCYWTVNGVPNQAIDGCVDSEGSCPNGPATTIAEASLMSYCSGESIPLSNGFGPLPGNLMRANYQYAVDNGCLTTSTNDDVFNAFPFLSNLVDAGNCNNERITVFKKGTHSYIHVETNSSSKLYYQSGGLWCTETGNMDCIKGYDLYEIDMLWACCDDGNEGGNNGNNPQPCDNDDVFATFPFLSNYINENNCTSGEINVYKAGAHNYIHVETANSGKLYFQNGNLFCTDSPGYDCVALYGLTNIEANWTCCTDDNGGNEGGGNQPCDDEGVFTEFPFLAAYVDENNCSSEQLTVYSAGTHNYIHVETPNSGKLYYQSGDLFCTDSPGYNCVELYNLSVVESSWTCCNAGNFKHGANFADNIQVFPNPNNGIFNIILPESLNDSAKINVYNIQGMLLKSIESTGLKLQTIDVSNIEKGICFIEVISSSEILTERIIVK